MPVGSINNAPYPNMSNTHTVVWYVGIHNQFDSWRAVERASSMQASERIKMDGNNVIMWRAQSSWWFRMHVFDSILHACVASAACHTSQGWNHFPMKRWNNAAWLQWGNLLLVFFLLCFVTKDCVILGWFRSSGHFGAFFLSLRLAWADALSCIW